MSDTQQLHRHRFPRSRFQDLGFAGCVGARTGNTLSANWRVKPERTSKQKLLSAVAMSVFWYVYIGKRRR